MGYLIWLTWWLSHSHTLKGSSPAILETNTSSTLLPRQAAGASFQSISASKRHGQVSHSQNTRPALLSAIDGKRKGRRVSFPPMHHSPADKHQGQFCTHTLSASSPATPTSRVNSTVLTKRGAGLDLLFSLPVVATSLICHQWGQREGISPLMTLPQSK